MTIESLPKPCVSLYKLRINHANGLLHSNCKISLRSSMPKFWGLLNEDRQN